MLWESKWGKNPYSEKMGNRDWTKCDKHKFSLLLNFITLQQTQINTAKKQGNKCLGLHSGSFNRSEYWMLDIGLGCLIFYSLPLGCTTNKERAAWALQKFSSSKLILELDSERKQALEDTDSTHTHSLVSLATSRLYKWFLFSFEISIWPLWFLRTCFMRKLTFQILFVLSAQNIFAFMVLA